MVHTVGMISSYQGLHQWDWLWSQTPHPCGRWGNIQILAPAQNPDYLLLYNFHDFPIDPAPIPLWQRWRRSRRAQRAQQLARNAQMRDRLTQLPQERMISIVREPPFPEKKGDRIRHYVQAQDYCGRVFGPDDWAPIPHDMPAIWYYNRSFQDLNSLPAPMKTERCCWITSGIARTVHHRRRLDFLRLARTAQVPFDLYGRDLPPDLESRGTVFNKANILAPYYYNLAIENYADNDWYVSEKLWDALLGWCLPIYYGGSAADRLLPPGSFLRLPSLDRAGVAYIQEVTANLDAWHEAREAIAEARQIILHKLNLVNWLSELIDS